MIAGLFINMLAKCAISICLSVLVICFTAGNAFDPQV